MLFIDEIHRFNKAQQDALLPHVEDGTVTLIGATTENPYFEVNSALLSRMRVWRLEPLADEDVAPIVRRALDDQERGLAGVFGPSGGVAIADEPFEHLVGLAGGDARQALNILEGAVALAEDEDDRDAEGRVSPTLAHVEGAAQQRVLAYDRAGDGHYDTVCAFIKSLRGNDPDAALYWLAAMVAAGEDPQFIVRRLIICASEDIGNADPRALQVAVAAAQALDYVGLPEAQYALAQATIYLAVAPKSNRSGTAYGAAMATSSARLAARAKPPRNAGDRRMKHHGIGVGYLYPARVRGLGRRAAVPPDELRTGATSSLGRGQRAADRRADGRASRTSRGGQAKRIPQPPGSGMSGIGDGMKANMEARKKLAKTQKEDAGDGA